MKIMKKLGDIKDKAVEKATDLCEKAKDAVIENPDTTMYVILFGGLTILYGQSIHYMHLLNKQAKRGVFKFIPGQGYVA